MPRTRIRAKAPLVVNTGGGGTTDGTNPPGSSLTVDGFSIAIAADEPAATPGDTATFALAVASSDVNLTPEESSQFFVIMQGVGDAAATPTEARAYVANIGATSVTAANTAGTGWVSPANAQGLSDGTNATMTGAAGLSPARQTGTLTGVYDSVGTPVETFSGTVTVTVHWSLTIALLTTGSFAFDISTDSGTNYTNLFTVTATANGPGVFSRTIAIANLGQVRFRAAASVQGAAVAPSSATLDAVVLTFTTT